MMRAIDSRQQDPFGIRKLVTVEVDGLHATPRHVRGEAIETPTTLVSYAAWRRRGRFVSALLKAGADPTVHGGRPHGLPAVIADVRALLDELPSRSAVYFVEQIVRLRCATSLAARRRVAPPQTECDACGSVAEPPLLLPCGHACSEACVWAAACGPKHRGELRCPKCAELLGGRSSSCWQALAASAAACGVYPNNDVAALGGTEWAAVACAKALADSWTCDHCFCSNYRQRANCRNCGFEQSASAAQFDDDGAAKEEEESRQKMELPPGEEVCIEIEVERRRTLGKSLCFVNGPLVVAGGGADDGGGRTIVQVVLDLAALRVGLGNSGGGEDDGFDDPLRNDAIRLLWRGAVSGERVRARGVRRDDLPAPNQSETKGGGIAFEVLATECTLLRPLILVPRGPPPQMQGAPKKKWRAAPALEGAVEALRGKDDDARLDALMGAAVSGDTFVVAALAQLGFGVAAARDKYGCAALLVAAAHGRAAVVEALLALGASPDAAAHGGATPATAAAANGHGDVLRLLEAAGADLAVAGAEGLPPVAYVLRRALAAAPPAALGTVWRGGGGGGGGGGGARCTVCGKGAAYIDGGFDEGYLARLLALFGSLPLAERMKCSQGLNDRAYYLDAEGWVRDGLAAAVRRCGAAAPCAGEAMAHMRFLLYAEAGGGLPPHVDLTRTDHRGRTSTHTFILYLTDCAAGGETVLLEAIAQPSGVVATVTPKKGRLFVFPHAHPHMAREVVAEGLPKVLLRGECM